MNGLKRMRWVQGLFVVLTVISGTLLFATDTHATNVSSSFTKFIQDERSRPASEDQAYGLYEQLSNRNFSACTNTASYVNGAVNSKDGPESFTSLINWMTNGGTNLTTDWVNKSNALTRNLAGGLETSMQLEANQDATNPQEGWCTYIVRMATDVKIPITGKAVTVSQADQNKTNQINAAADKCSSAFSTASGNRIGTATQIRTFLTGLNDEAFKPVAANYGAINSGGPDSAACTKLTSALQVEINKSIKSECGTDASQTDSGCDDNATTCIIDGIGWLVCTAARQLGIAIDGFYSLVRQYLEVPPLNTDTSSPSNFVYQVWRAMLGFANVAFAIVFLIIIFSQLTGAGISNYGVKKALPRVVIAVVLVNISYWLCAVLIDLSNIAGAGLYQILSGITENSGGIKVDGGQPWEYIITFLLAGATVGTTLVGGALVVVAGTGGAVLIAVVWAVITAALGAILAIIVCFAVLAARQGLIILLVIVSPLAFVAMLLPNTERFFKLWRSSLTTMLVFYPIFALLFGGSQLASLAILSSSSSVGGDVSGPIIILALFVQVAPLVLTPLLIKFSGGIIGQLAGQFNNRNKGLIDRARNVRNRKAGLAYGETMGSEVNPMSKLNNRYAGGAVNIARKGYRGLKNSAKRDADRRKVIDGTDSAAYAETEKGQMMYEQIKNLGERQNIADTKAESRRISNDPAKQLGIDLHNAKIEGGTIEAENVLLQKEQENSDLVYQTQVAKNATEVLEGRDKARYRESLYDKQAIDPSNPLATSIQQARDAELEQSINRDRQTGADGLLQRQYAQQLQPIKDSNGNIVTDVNGVPIKNDIAERAAGVDPQGVSRVTARSVQVVDEATSKAVAAETVLIRESRADPTELVANIAARKNITGQTATPEQMKAMIEYAVKNGTTNDVIELNNTLAATEFDVDVANVGYEIADQNAQLMQTFGAVAQASGKVKLIGGSSFGELAKGKQISTYNVEMGKRVGGMKVKAETVASMDVDEVENFTQYIEQNANIIGLNQQQALHEAIYKRLNDERLSASLDQNDRIKLESAMSRLAEAPQAPTPPSAPNSPPPSAPSSSQGPKPSPPPYRPYNPPGTPPSNP